MVYKKKLKVPIDIKSPTELARERNHMNGNVPKLYYSPGDKQLLEKLEKICADYKKGIITSL